MKKTYSLIMMITLAVLLSACGQSSDQAGNQAAAASVENSASVQEGAPEGTLEPGGFQFEIPLQSLLILGTFNLEDTDLAVQSEQAKELLPLWQVLKSLLESETAAAEEIEALINQIAETMSEEQMQAIETMDLTMADFNALNEKLGLDLAFQRPEGVEEGEGGNGFQRPEGMPEGLRPGGGPGGGGEGLSPEEIESFRATREASGGGIGSGLRGAGRMNIPLIEALIELLQTK